MGLTFEGSLRQRELFLPAFYISTEQDATHFQDDFVNPISPDDDNRGFIEEGLKLRFFLEHMLVFVGTLNQLRQAAPRLSIVFLIDPDASLNAILTDKGATIDMSDQALGIFFVRLCHFCFDVAVAFTPRHEFRYKIDRGWFRIIR